MHLLYKFTLLSLLCVNTLVAQEHLIKDDIDGKVSEKENIKKPLLSDKLQYLKDDYHLDLIVSYMAIGQYDTISDQDGSGDRVDIVAHYTPTNALSLGMKLEVQRAFGAYSSGQFSKAIGSLNKVSPSYADLDPYLKELWADYKFNDLDIRAGVINTSSFVDKSFYNNFAKFFLSHAYSSQSYGHIPLSSLGIGVKYTKEEYYVNAVLSDATEHLEDAIDDIRDNDLSLYSTMEAGYTPDKNIYFINVWHREEKNGDTSYGMYISLNQYLNETNKIYAKYGVNKNAAIKQHFSLGWSQDALFSGKDLLLTGFSSSQAESTSDFQNSLEILYKYKFDHGIELSGDLQIIKDPTTQEDWVVMPSVRLRVVF